MTLGRWCYILLQNNKKKKIIQAARKRWIILNVKAELVLHSEWDSMGNICITTSPRQV